MAGKNSQIETILDKISDVQETIGIFVISSDGSLISAKILDDSEGDKVKSKLIEFTTTANEVVSNLGFSDLDQILIDGKSKIIIVQRNQKQDFFLSLVGKEAMNVGLARVIMKSIMQELESVIAS